MKRILCAVLLSVGVAAQAFAVGNPEGHDSNEWQVNVTAIYSLPGNDAAEKNKVEWTLDNQPLPMAHTLVQASVHILNSGLFQIYAQLLAESGEQEASAKLRAVVANIGM